MYSPRKLSSTIEVRIKLILIPKRIISKAKSTNNKLGLRIIISKAKIKNNIDNIKVVNILYCYETIIGVA
jgi:hypothetical protein